MALLWYMNKLYEIHFLLTEPNVLAILSVSIAVGTNDAVRNLIVDFIVLFGSS